MEKTINEVFYNRVLKYKDRIAVEKKQNGKWEPASWKKYYQMASAVGLYLDHLGVRKQDKVALLSENRLEWLYTDMGALGIGACVVPIYTTLVSEDIQYIVEHSDAKVLFIENKQQFDKIAGQMDQDRMPGLEKVVIFDAKELELDNNRLIAFDTALSIGQKIAQTDPDCFGALARNVNPSDLASIVYTSGTTGVPKGVMISHRNIMAVVESLSAIKPQFADDTDQTVPFLPLSHVFERVAGHFFGMYVGITSSYAESIQTFAQDVKEKRPTVVLAVPRVCEKVYQQILLKVSDAPFWKRKIFDWGLDIGMQISSLREINQKVCLGLRLKYKIAYHFIFKNLSQALGGRVRWMTAAGAPTSRDIVLFFNAAGITVVEGYGMTETCAPTTMSNLANYRIGTVGKPIPHVDIKLADDGEILIKGENVFSGYYKMEAETKTSFTLDGYFKSGDIGAFENGFLSITDRKKDLIITSGGKNIAPQKIEGLFKTDPLFSHFLVIGERRKFLSALLCINMEYAPKIAELYQIAYSDINDLIENQHFRSIVDQRIQAKNTHLARYETIKKYWIIGQEFSEPGGELTASMKMKRNVIYDKYKDVIEQMYAA